MEVYQVGDENSAGNDGPKERRSLHAVSSCSAHGTTLVAKLPGEAFYLRLVKSPPVWPGVIMWRTGERTGS